MANNYTQFSVMLPLPEKAGMEEVFGGIWEVQREEAENDPECEAYEIYGGFEYEIQPGEGVWVHDEDGNGNPEAAAGFIQRYLKDLDIKEAVYMSWANTCSKPRINEFDGGGVVITATKMYWRNSYGAIQFAVDDGVDACSIIGG